MHDRATEPRQSRQHRTPPLPGPLVTVARSFAPVPKANPETGAKVPMDVTSGAHPLTAEEVSPQPKTSSTLVVSMTQTLPPALGWAVA